jgi:hypothetical protein
MTDKSPTKQRSKHAVWLDTGMLIDNLERMLNERDRLREWVKLEGLRTDTCTRSILGEVCENCRCGKATK